jgi:hypothetical protein
MSEGCLYNLNTFKDIVHDVMYFMETSAWRNTVGVNVHSVMVW